MHTSSLESFPQSANQAPSSENEITTETLVVENEADPKPPTSDEIMQDPPPLFG